MEICERRSGVGLQDVIQPSDFNSIAGELEEVVVPAVFHLQDIKHL